MTDPEHRHLVIWEARHENGWTTLVMEQPDGTFVAWAGPDESVGVDHVADTPESETNKGGPARRASRVDLVDALRIGA